MADVDVEARDVGELELVAPLARKSWSVRFELDGQIPDVRRPRHADEAL